MCLLAFVYLLWKNANSDLLHIFKLSFLFFWYWSIWAIYKFWLLTSTEWEKISANVSLFFFYLGDRNTALDDDAILQVLILMRVFTGASLFPRSHSTWHTQLHLKSAQSLLQHPGCWTLVVTLLRSRLCLHHFSGHILAEMLLNWVVLGLMEASGAWEWKLLTLRIEILWITAKENKKQTDVQLQNEGDLAVMFVKCFRGY